MDSLSNLFRPGAKADVFIFLTQVLLLFIVVITSLVNLSLDNGNTNLWTMVLTSCLGYMMPNPRLKSTTQQNSIASAIDISDQVVARKETDGNSDHEQQKQQQTRPSNDGLILLRELAVKRERDSERQQNR